MSYRVLGLAPQQFAAYFALDEDALRAAGGRRVLVDEPTLPCRISLDHARLGEEVLLVNFEHQAANSPYRASHAIFIRAGFEEAAEAVDHLPQMLSSRLLSIRAFDAEAMMLDAEVCEGTAAETLFEQMFKDPKVLYLHVHTARRGCYLARVERA